MHVRPLNNRITHGLAVVAFALAAAESKAVAQEAGKDLAMNFRMSTWSTGGSSGVGPDSSVMTGRAVTSGDRMRYDLEATAGRTPTPFVGGGASSSAIVSGGGKTITYLDTKSRQYMQLRPAEMLAGVARDLKMERNYPEISLNRVGTGPVILGHPTVQYRFTYRATAMITGFGEPRSMITTNTTDYFFATDLPSALDPIAGIMGTDMQAMFASDDQALRDRLKAVQDTLPNLTLLRTSATTITSLGEKTSVTRTETDITSLRWIKANPELFEIPAGYSELKFPGLGNPASTP